MKYIGCSDYDWSHLPTISVFNWNKYIIGWSISNAKILRYWRCVCIQVIVVRSCQRVKLSVESVLAGSRAPGVAASFVLHALPSVRRCATPAWGVEYGRPVGQLGDQISSLRKSGERMTAVTSQGTWVSIHQTSQVPCRINSVGWGELFSFVNFFFKNIHVCFFTMSVEWGEFFILQSSFF